MEDESRKVMCGYCRAGLRPARSFQRRSGTRSPAQPERPPYISSDTKEGFQLARAIAGDIQLAAIFQTHLPCPVEPGNQLGHVFQID